MSRLTCSKETLWPALSGLLLAAAYPRPDLAPLAWFALVPLFALRSQRPFRAGWISGAVFFACVLYWLNIVMTTYGGLNLLFSVVAYLLLVGYLALYFGATLWLAQRFEQQCRWSRVWTLPVAWTAFEYLRAHLLTGFPWASLGYSQDALLPMLQSADLWGVYGIGFLLVLVNALLADIWRLRQADRRLVRCGWRLALATLLLVGNAGYGWWRLGTNLDGGRPPLQVSLIQGDIDQAVKWDPAFQQQTLQRYAELTLKADSKVKTDLTVWPESATPFFFQEGGPAADLVRSLPQKTGSALLFGSPAYERHGKKYSYLNSAYLLAADGRLLGRSDKVHLVPFGEYVPLKWMLPFVDKLVVGIGDFVPGRLRPLAMNGDTLGVLVCYEAIFPELARSYITQGAGLLVNITNDAWFGRSAAPYQHLGMARLRAIENRVWLVRAANTGISAAVAPSGRIIKASKLFVPAALNVRAGFGARGGIYSSYGDLLPWVCLLLGAAGLIFCWTRNRRRLEGENSTRPPCS